MLVGWLVGRSVPSVGQGPNAEPSAELSVQREMSVFAVFRRYFEFC